MMATAATALEIFRARGASDYGADGPMLVKLMSEAEQAGIAALNAASMAAASAYWPEEASPASSIRVGAG
jgi:hypothetical protein